MVDNKILKKWLETAGVDMGDVLARLNGLRAEKEASLEKARTGDPGFFGRVATFAGGVPRVPPDEIKKAVAQIQTLIAEIDEVIQALS